MPEFRNPGLKVPESGTKSSDLELLLPFINVINSLQCRASSSYSIAPSRFSFFITPLPCFSLFSGPIRTSYARHGSAFFRKSCRSSHLTLCLSCDDRRRATTSPA